MIIAPGTALPELSLARTDGSRLERTDLLGAATVLAFYPAAFSPVCTDQMAFYDEAVDELARLGVRIYGVSTDPPEVLREFAQTLRLRIEQLSDEAGEAARRLGVFNEPTQTAARALVIVDAGGIVRFSHRSAELGDAPGVNVIFDALRGIADGEPSR